VTNHNPLKQPRKRQSPALKDRSRLRGHSEDRALGVGTVQQRVAPDKRRRPDCRRFAGELGVEQPCTFGRLAKERELRRGAILAASLAVAACATTVAPTKSTVRQAGGHERASDVVGGWGGFPITDRVTSLWLTAAEAGRTGRSQPLLMVYYVGAPGWHDAKWTFDAEITRLPGYARLKSERFELSVEYQGGGRALVQGKPVALSSGNVFLVAPIDGQWSVKPLARVDFDVPPGANPAVHILSAHPEIRAAVMGGSECLSGLTSGCS